MEAKLVSALQDGDSEQLLRLCGKLDKNIIVTVSSLNADSEPPAQPVAHQVACRSSSAQSFAALLSRLGPDLLESRNSSGDTPVHCAARYQSYAWLQLILNSLQDTGRHGGLGCFQLAGRSGRTPAHCAAQNKRSNSALKWLVREFGSRCLTVPDQFGFTPVHLAAWHQGVDSLQLIKNELGSNACFLWPGRCGRTPIHCAAANLDNSSVLTWLVNECGRASLEVADSNGDTVLHLAARHQVGTWLMRVALRQLGPDCLKRRGKWRRTVVHSAAMNSRDSSALKLMARRCGRDCLTAVDAFGNTPVHLAAWKQGADSMVLMKQSLGAECFQQRGQFERKAMHWAAMNRSGISALKWLVDKLGADSLLELTYFGNTPVHLAAWKQGAESMALAKSHLGARCFDARGQCGRSVLHKAALNTAGNSALKWLVEQCGSGRLSETDDQGNTVAHLAAWKQGKDSLNFIADSIGKEAMRSRGNANWTLAHMAAQNVRSSSALVWCVNNFGKDCLLDKDSKGRSPAHLAARYQGLESLSLIKNCLGVAAFHELKDSKGLTVAQYAAQNEDAQLILAWIAEQQKEDECSDSEQSDSV